MAWDDLVLGPRQVKLAAISDPVLMRADGTPTYTFASAVDDLDFGDHPRDPRRGSRDQRRRAARPLAALGGDPARLRLAHLPLLLATAGEKLSKRLEGASLRRLRHDGIEPAAITAYLARLGTSDDPVPLPLHELARDFDFGHFSPAPRGSTSASCWR